MCVSSSMNLEPFCAMYTFGVTRRIEAVPGTLRRLCTLFPVQGSTVFSPLDLCVLLCLPLNVVSKVLCFCSALPVNAFSGLSRTAQGMMSPISSGYSSACAYVLPIVQSGNDHIVMVLTCWACQGCMHYVKFYCCLVSETGGQSGFDPSEFPMLSLGRGRQEGAASGLMASTNPLARQGFNTRKSTACVESLVRRTCKKICSLAIFLLLYLPIYIPIYMHATYIV